MGVTLENLGYRLGEYKGSFGKTTDWKEWSQEMQDYCIQDVIVTTNYASFPAIPEWVTLEHEVATILTQQEHHGCT